MEEREFRNLLEKSIEGSITKEEQQILDAFQETLKRRLKHSFDDDLKKSQLKESIWLAIQKRIGFRSRNKVINWRLVSSVAAVFIGCLIVWNMYLDQPDKSESILPSDIVTLELEDGTIKVLDESKKGLILNTSGNVVSRQNNNKLIYEKSNDQVKRLTYNTLTIPYGKTYEVILSDGTKAHLNAGSSLRYPVQFIEGKERTVFVNGEVFLDVAKNKEDAFIVNTKELNIKVYGTKFNVNSYPEDQVTEVVLVEGSVGLYTGDLQDTDNTTLLTPNYKASFDKVNKVITKDRVITDIYTSWMNGELVFRNMKFENILKKLERHYDVTIINNNTSLSNEKFNASFGIAPLIDNVLEELKITYGITYIIKDNTITIN